MLIIKYDDLVKMYTYIVFVILNIKYKQMIELNTTWALKENYVLTVFLHFKLWHFYIEGGQGFLGQHIIRLLQQDERVAEIRVLDKKVLTNRIGTIGVYTWVLYL